jgi:phosphohistidine phosphatase
MGPVKTLYLMRHAKSSWDDPRLADEDRPLTARGHKAADRMARYMKGAGFVPSVVLCTSALRARETLELLRPVLSKETTVKIEPRLYSASSKELLTRIKRLSPTATSVLLIGHNPAMQDLTLGLVSKTRKFKTIREKFPTGALAVLAADVDEWRHLEPGKASLVDFVTPKKLEARQKK